MRDKYPLALFCGRKSDDKQYKYSSAMNLSNQDLTNGCGCYRAQKVILRRKNLMDIEHYRRDARQKGSTRLSPKVFTRLPKHSSQFLTGVWIHA